jgi:hypothetical protein
VWGMTISTTRSVPDGFVYVLGCASDPLNNQMGWVYDNNNGFEQEGSYPVQAVGLVIQVNVARITVQAGDYLTITNEVGEEMKVYLPALDTMDDVTLYIGADGATYHDIALTSVACAAPTGLPLQVNFQPATATPPYGFYRDHGVAEDWHWGSVGQQEYGW